MALLRWVHLRRLRADREADRGARAGRAAAEEDAAAIVRAGGAAARARPGPDAGTRRAGHSRQADAAAGARGAGRARRGSSGPGTRRASQRGNRCLIGAGRLAAPAARRSGCSPAPFPSRRWPATATR